MRVTVMALLFATALLLRLYRIWEPPLDFHPTRQYRSALIARGYYLRSIRSVPEWRREVASANMRQEGIIEPPVMESIAAMAYRIVGREELWIPRLCSSLFWLVGGLMFYGLAKRLTPADAALLATAMYLFIPFGVQASRSFQPDPFMVMLSIAAVYAITNCFEKPSYGKWVLAALLSSAAVLIKPVAAFWILGAFFALAIYYHGIYKAISGAWCWLFIPSIFLLTVAYYIYGLLTHQYGLDWTGGRFIPRLLVSGFFWKGWMQMLTEVIGGPYLIMAFLGLVVVCQLHSGTARPLLTGLWIGYGAYCAVFTWHVPTHDYYHLPLIPVVALSIAGLICYVLTRMARVCSLRLLRVVAVCVLLLIVCHGAYHACSIGIPPGRFREIALAREIGEKTGHSVNAIVLSDDYGKPLRYYGELAGVNWPHRYDFVYFDACGMSLMGAEERYRLLSVARQIDYFIVTDLQELEAQEDLKRLLTEIYPNLAKKNTGYAIFDLRNEVSKNQL
jgi:hypothetical protein